MESVANALQERGHYRHAFINAWREQAGWTCSYRFASQRLAHWLNPESAHRFPLEAIPTLIRVVGHAAFLDPLLALEQRVSRDRRMRKVEPETMRSRRSA